MTLNVRSRGAGRDLVLVHGWGTHGGIWSELAENLSLKYRVHAVDLPGCGESAGCDPYTLDHIVMMLRNELPPQCGVVGWSLGGQIALSWAQRAPAQVERIALIATSPCFSRRADWPHAVSGELLDDFRRALAEEGLAPLRRFYSLGALGDRRARKAAARLRGCLKNGGAPSAAALEGGLKVLLDTDQREVLGAVSQPALVLHGDQDRVAPLAAGQQLSRRLPNAEFVVISGAAHLPFVTALPEVAGHLSRFFQ